ncbi:carboxylesterase family protein [Nonomuraea insulae]|uniref:Carboxylesterase family protein n=1 Tax=Nonomuraea insulae TaxID=1616787 RepID=A0ABW1CLG4_9ACTN
MAGQSAGAGSVAALLTMKSARGLFRRAIAHSVPGLHSTPALARQVTAAFADRLGAAAPTAEVAERWRCRAATTVSSTESTSVPGGTPRENVWFQDRLVVSRLLVNVRANPAGAPRPGPRSAACWGAGKTRATRYTRSSSPRLSGWCSERVRDLSLIVGCGLDERRLVGEVAVAVERLLSGGFPPRT